MGQVKTQARIDYKNEKFTARVKKDRVGIKS